MTRIATLVHKERLGKCYKWARRTVLSLSVVVFLIAFVALFANFLCNAFPLGGTLLGELFKCQYWLIANNFTPTFVAACATLLSTAAVVAGTFKG